MTIIQTFPSLFGLFKDGFLPPKTHIVGYARSDLERKDFEERLTGGLDEKEVRRDAQVKRHIVVLTLSVASHQSKDKIEEFKKISTYVKGAYDEDDAFKNLESELQKMADKDFDGESHRIYYVSCFP